MTDTYKVTMPNGEVQHWNAPKEDTPLLAVQMIGNTIRLSGQSVEGAKVNRVKGDK